VVFCAVEAGVGELVAGFSIDRVGVKIATAVPVRDGVLVIGTLEVGTPVADGFVGFELGVAVADLLGAAVGAMVIAVLVGAGVTIDVAVTNGILVKVGVEVGVRVFVGFGVSVLVGLGVGVG